jgi:hypothetical protein
VRHHSDMSTDADGVWVFNGDDGRFAGGVSTSREKADAWIAANKLNGVLTLYPLDIPEHWRTPRISLPMGSLARCSARHPSR